ncbi:MAG: serine/threonine protein kinase, partial [Planctomycetes bacterium]|nr:serine/threonine protein kinase [Planctomycetota bacterium]
PQAPGPATVPAVDAASSQSQQAAEIAGYELMGLIGEGNMGRVYKARQKSLDRLVALKLLNDVLTRDPTYVERFMQEARAAARFQHPNVVSVIDQGVCPRTGIQFIAFELINGESAQVVMERRGKLPEEEALRIALGIAEALACASQHGIVHRDVKPDNILIGRDGIAKLADLGLAKARDPRPDLTGPMEDSADSLSGSGMVVGTPHYMAPEQALGLEVDIRADLYSLGVSLFYLVTGSFPFECPTALGLMTRHINEDVPDVRSFNPEVSGATAALIEGLCMRDRDARYPSPSMVASDIERILAGHSPLGPGSTEAQLPGRHWKGSTTTSLLRRTDEEESIAPLEVSAPPELGRAAALRWAFLQTGELEHLERLERLYQEAALASDEVEAAKATAGLAEVQALRGNTNAAARLAHRALSKDPGCRPAVKLIVESRLGTPGEALFSADMTRLSGLLGAKRFADAFVLAGQARREYPSEPLPHLALVVAATQSNDRGAFRESLQLARALSPSRRFPLVTFHDAVELQLIEQLVTHGREALLSGVAELVRQTVEDTAAPANLVAGALQLALWRIHTVLAAPARLEDETLARLLLWKARALAGLQYFSAANEVLTQLESDAAYREIDAEARREERALVERFLDQGGPGIRPRFEPITANESGDVSRHLQQHLRLCSGYYREADDELAALGANLLSQSHHDPEVDRELRAHEVLRRELAEADLKSSDAGGWPGRRARLDSSHGSQFLVRVMDRVSTQTQTVPEATSALPDSMQPGFSFSVGRGDGTALEGVVLVRLPAGDGALVRTRAGGLNHLGLGDLNWATLTRSERAVSALQPGDEISIKSQAGRIQGDYAALRDGELVVRLRSERELSFPYSEIVSCWLLYPWAGFLAGADFRVASRSGNVYEGHCLKVTDDACRVRLDSGKEFDMRFARLDLESVLLRVTLSRELLRAEEEHAAARSRLEEQAEQLRRVAQTFYRTFAAQGFPPVLEPLGLRIQQLSTLKTCLREHQELLRKAAGRML